MSTLIALIATTAAILSDSTESDDGDDLSERLGVSGDDTPVVEAVMLPVSSILRYPPAVPIRADEIRRDILDEGGWPREMPPVIVTDDNQLYDVTDDNQLYDGAHRLDAAIAAGLEFVPAIRVDSAAVWMTVERLGLEDYEDDEAAMKLIEEHGLDPYSGPEASGLSCPRIPAE